MKASIRMALVALVTLGTVACDSNGIAYGDVNSIIAVSSPELWEEIKEDTQAALEPTIRTVRNEKTFTVTYQQPYGEHWAELRRFRQMLLIGTAEDGWIIEAIDRSGETITTPGTHQIYDVWARGQAVTVILLPPGGGADDVRAHLPAVNEKLDGQFRTWVRNRMYMSGVDSALADTLYLEQGFALTLPDVYDWRQSDSVFMFRNDQPDPSELIRQVSVSWRTPIPVDMQPEGILEWRNTVANTYYSEPQDQVLDNANAEPFEFRGQFAYQIQAEWRNPPERNWPAGGPFITRAIVCESQNRMYLIDGWLYAPGKEKYEYMIQLETILESFRCGSA